MVRNVAIVGAGIGGLAAAIALRSRGIDVQVYEKARELRPVGAGLTLFPNGLKSLDAIAPEIVEVLKGVGSQTRAVHLRHHTGEFIVQTPVTLLERYGQPMLTLRWSRLQATLAAALPPEILHLGWRCTGFTQDADGVAVHFDDGATVQTDLLVGADGIHSTIRQHLVGDGPPRYTGRMSWRAVLTYRDERLPSNEATILTSGGKTFLITDVGDGYVFWSAGALCADDAVAAHPAAVKARLLEAFAGWAEPVPAIIAATAAADIVERPIWDRPPLARWSQGRVTLLGDAAHPMVPSLGQGGNTAFEDAVELAHCVWRAPDITTALADYEDRRIQRTQVIQARSAFQGSRAYDLDSDRFLRGVAEQAQASQNAFEDWLYTYTPPGLPQAALHIAT